MENWGLLLMLASAEEEDALLAIAVEPRLSLFSSSRNSCCSFLSSDMMCMVVARQCARQGVLEIDEIGEEMLS